jgi:hypothetical protein
MTTIKQNQAAVWLQLSGPGTAFQVYAVGDKNIGVTGKSIPFATTTPVYERDRFSRPVVLTVNEAAPGDLPTLTLNIYEQKTLNVLERWIQDGCPLSAQIRIVECGVLDNPFLWDKVQHWDRGRLTTYNPGDGPVLGYNSEVMQAAGSLSFERMITVVNTALSAQTTGEAEDILAIDGIPDIECGGCGGGYPGKDMILVAGAAAAAAATANLLTSLTGGSSWTAAATDPFAADEDIGFVIVTMINRGYVRVIAGTPTTDIAAKAKIAWYDVLFGDIAAPTWNTVFITGSANGDVIQALELIDGILYAATAGDIYLASDYGESLDDAAVYTGATAINGFAGNRERVFAFGATNLLLMETEKSGNFTARVGPAGGAAFTALAIADDGTVFAGNDTSIYKSTDYGATAGNWTLLKNFGAGFSVKKIRCINGSSQLLHVTVSDAADGQIWQTVEGGARWSQIADLSNDGYNDAYASEIDPTKVVIAANSGAIHALSPA